MRGLLGLLAALLVCIPLCRAENELESMEGLDRLWTAAEEYGVEADISLEQGLDALIRAAQSQAGLLWKKSLRVGVQLLGVVLLCGLAEAVYPGAGGVSASRMAGALAITALSVSNVQAMIGLGRETIEKMSAFSRLLLPVMAALTAATGKAGSAAVRQGATVLFSQLLLQTIHQLLIPLVYCYVACCCAYAAVGNEGVKKIGAMLKGAIHLILTTILLAFVGYLTMSGAIAGSADAAAIKAAKMTISRAVPVVGSILSDAAESILVGAGVLKGTVGLVGALAVLAICLGPFLQLAFHYLSYKLTAALTASVADSRLSGLLDSVGAAFGLVLGMTGACALLLLISLVSAVSAVLT